MKFAFSSVLRMVQDAAGVWFFPGREDDGPQAVKLATKSEGESA